MIARRSYAVLGAVAAALCVCSVAHANSISPYVYFWPGVISIMPYYAFPASVLAAFLERPFLTTGGIKRGALIYSLRANFVSAIVGLLCTVAAAPLIYMSAVIWPITAFGISCAVEISYLRSVSEQSVKSGWVIAGNAVSSGVLMVLPPLAIAIRQRHLELALALEPHEAWLCWTSFAVSVVLFVGSFTLPIGAAPDSPPHKDQIGDADHFAH